MIKKTLLLLASATLLLVGCAKEKFAEPIDGGMTSVTFSASVDGGVATKAAADNDGKGTKVNRCIMEIYFQDQLYKRLEQPVTPASGETKAFATFSNVPVVAGKEYEILFWADHVDVVNTEAGLATDKYYTTKTTTGNKGLKAVTVKKADFIDALKNKKNDELDAFFGADKYTVGQTTNNNFNITLYRPFAQLNVITTDVAAGKTVTSADLLPDKVSVSYKADNTINVATGETSKVGQTEADYTFAYEAPVYGESDSWSDVKNRGELTLSMDYILASTEQGAVDVTFKTKNGENVVMSHSLANLPYKRNYRTNVKGDLLTTAGSWTAKIDPIWGVNGDGGEIDHIIASSYTDVVNALQSGNDSKNMKVTVTPAAVNNLSDAEKAQVILDETIDGEPVKALKFVLYEEKKDGEEIIQQASPEHVEFELPERPDGVDAWKIEYEEKYPTQTVVVSTKEEDNANVIIEAPKSTVTLDARKINSVVSTTSENTLIIPQGLELTNLEVKKGAVEYHGKGLTKVTVAPLEGAKVSFKTSEGLADTPEVYGVVKDHVAEGFAITKETETTWKIVPTVCKIDEAGYGSVSDAFAAVENGQTIVMLQNDVLTKGQTITLANNDAFTLDLNGKKISIAETGFDFAANNTKSSNAIRSGIPARFAVVVTGQGTMNICDNSADKLGCFETKDYSYGSTKTILVDGNAVVNMNSGTIASDYASFYVVGYTATGAVPANAPKPTLNVNGGKILSELVGIGIKGNTATLKVTGGEIIGKGYYGISTNGTTDWYDGGKFAIEITGGSIKSEEGAAMYLPAEGPTVISGGEIEGTEGIAVKGGSLSISGDAVIKSHGAYGEPSAATSGYTQTGSCIYVEDTYPDHSPFVNISGGKFSSDNNKAVEYYTNKTDDATNKGKVSLSGGLYSDKPEAALIAEYYEVIENSDAATKAQYPWTVDISSDFPYVAKIGANLYTSVQEAFKASKDNETIVLLKNTNKGSDQYTSKCGNNITFDLNGHKIESNNGQGVFHFQMSSYKTINFVDSKGNGGLVQLDSNPSSDTYGAICANGANVNIYAGYYETTPAYHGWTQVLYAKDGNITVYDGNFVGDLFTDNQFHHMFPEYAPEANTIEIFGGVFTGKVLDSYAEEGVKSEVVIHGGKFSFNPTDFLAPGASCSGIPDAEGYYVVTSNN